MMDIVYSAGAAMGDALGFEGVRRAGDMLGRLLWWTLPKRRAVAVEAVASHLELPYKAARRIARASFASNCRSFLELLLVRRVDCHFMADRLENVTPHLLAAAGTDSEPGIMAAAHLGGWETMAGVFQHVLEKQPKCIVVRSPKDQAFNRMLLHLRSRPDVRIIEHRNAAGPTLDVLRKKGVAAFLVDHNCRRNEALFLPFLGELAAVNMGPAVLAVRSKAAVWPVFLIRSEQGRYQLRMEEPLRTSTLSGKIQDRVRQVAEFYTKAVEKQIRQTPEQWFWMHRRWKTRPE